MASFSIFQDSPARPTGSSFTFRSRTSLSVNNTASTPNHDKENVNPLTCIGSTTRNSKKSKRKYFREEGAGPLSMKKKVKVAFVGDATDPLKKGDCKKRRILGGVSNAALGPASLTRTDTLILDELTETVNRRAIELTVSPLADASEAYLSLPGSPILKQENSSSISGHIEESTTSFADLTTSQDFFSSSQSSQASKSSQRSLSPMISCSLPDEVPPASPTLDLSDIVSVSNDIDICLQIPLPPSP